jgi:hypothetical protein
MLKVKLIHGNEASAMASFYFKLKWALYNSYKSSCQSGFFLAASLRRNEKI